MENLNKYIEHTLLKQDASKEEIVKLLKTGWVGRPDPDFYWNEKVCIIAKDITARIELICWHYNEKRYFYHLIDFHIVLIFLFLFPYFVS